MERINASELVSRVSALTGDSKATVKRILDNTADFIVGAVKEGQEVVFPTIGKFYPKERNARTSRNPKTGEVIEVPAKTGFKFKPNNDVKNLGD